MIACELTVSVFKAFTSRKWKLLHMSVPECSSCDKIQKEAHRNTHTHMCTHTHHLSTIDLFPSEYISAVFVSSVRLELCVRASAVCVNSVSFLTSVCFLKTKRAPFFSLSADRLKYVEKKSAEL